VANNYNLFGHDGNAGVEGFDPGPTDIVPSAPLSAILLALADNGGATFTHALAIDSPALDASPADTDCLPTDQRGVPRPQGAACDIGAFEGSAVLCNGQVTTQVGTAGKDDLTGTPGADVIHGLGGDDVIRGLEGDDTLCGGSGRDALFGDSGADVLRGGSGYDRCNGGADTDTASHCETVIDVP
jgi:Ca2+-binding RTX toxin-like protein